MATPTTIVEGRLTADPELRFTPAGKAVCSFTVAASDRKKDDRTDTWSDGDKAFIRCTVWEVAGENVAESLKKGEEVIVIGNLIMRDYDDRDGNKRQSVEMKNARVAAAIGKFNTVSVRKLERVAAGQAPAQRNDDPWTAGGGSSFTDEPPF